MHVYVCEGVFRSTISLNRIREQEKKCKQLVLRAPVITVPAFYPHIRSVSWLVGRSVALCLFVFYLILSSSSHKNTQRLLFKG